MSRRLGEILEFLTRRGRWGSTPPDHIRKLAVAISKDILDALEGAGTSSKVQFEQDDQLRKKLLSYGAHVVQILDELQLPNWGRDRFLQWTCIALVKGGINKELADHIYSILDLVVNRKAGLVEYVRTLS